MAIIFCQASNGYDAGNFDLSSILFFSIFSIIFSKQKNITAEINVINALYIIFIGFGKQLNHR